jgi:hypothetical protein
VRGLDGLADSVRDQRAHGGIGHERELEEHLDALVLPSG